MVELVRTHDCIETTDGDVYGWLSLLIQLNDPAINPKSPPDFLYK